MNVDLSILRREVLRVRLALGRVGTGALIAGALLSGAAALWAVVLPGLSVRVEEQSREVALARAAPLPKPVVSAPALASQRLDAFYAALGDGSHTEQIVSGLFDAASATGVVLDRAEYKPAHDAAGRFDTYTVIMPLKGDYSSVRRFSEKVLVALPYAALDDMRFKRNSASDPAVEANLRFTAFLRPAVWASMTASQGKAASMPVSAPAFASASASASTSQAGEPIASSSSVFVSGAITVPSRPTATATPTPTPTATPTPIAVAAELAIRPAPPALAAQPGSVVPSGPAAMPTLPVPPAMALAMQSALAARPTSASLLSASSQQPVLMVRAAPGEAAR
jgi:hypothetical protein